MNWDDVGDAIQAAVERSSGVTTIWKHQNFNAPSLDYVTVSLGYMSSLGIDYIRTSYNPDADPGEEFELAVNGMREVPIEIEAFTAANTPGLDLAAMSLCEKTRNGLLLPSVRSLLKAQAVAPFDPGPVQWIPDIPSTNFRGRAVCSVRCYMRPPTVAEYVGYISRVTGQTIAFGVTGSSGLAYPFDSNNG